MSMPAKTGRIDRLRNTMIMASSTAWSDGERKPETHFDRVRQRAAMLTQIAAGLNAYADAATPLFESQVGRRQLRRRTINQLPACIQIRRHAVEGAHQVAHLPGGDLKLHWQADNHVLMTGPAVEVFTGEWVTEK